MIRTIRFCARNGMLNFQYARLLGRYLRRRLFTVAGHRWRTDGLLFLGRHLELQIARKVGDNDTLYGSVTNGDIADLLKQKGFDVDRRKILLPDAIRALGETLVPVKLHRDVTAQLKITVVKE